MLNTFLMSFEDDVLGPLITIAIFTVLISMMACAFRNLGRLTPQERQRDYLEGR